MTSGYEAVREEVKRWYGEGGVEVLTLLEEYLRLYCGHNLDGITENECIEFLWDYYPKVVLNVSEKTHQLAHQVVYFVLNFYEGLRDVV
ncbi:MAG: hypothetical protein J7L88_03605 [Thermoplasmata archaeon]|nr:hypothetical protein [Thermoplasmata archaeon]